MLYKVVEISTVTEDFIESMLNHWTTQGWQFDSIHFVVRDNSRRPSMAFLFFVQETPALLASDLSPVPEPPAEARPEPG